VVCSAYLVGNGVSYCGVQFDALNYEQPPKNYDYDPIVCIPAAPASANPFVATHLQRSRDRESSPMATTIMQRGKTPKDRETKFSCASSHPSGQYRVYQPAQDKLGYNRHI
jgi:hypothetical protein